MPRESLSEEEFRGFMENWPEPEYSIVMNRLEGNYSRERYEFLSTHEAEVLGAALALIIPQEEGIDLVGFMDWAISLPLGYGDREEGSVDNEALFHLGIAGIDETASKLFAGRTFTEIETSEQERVLRVIQEGWPTGGVWEKVRPEKFFRSLLEKAVAGYAAHPRTWMPSESK